MDFKLAYGQQQVAFSLPEEHILGVLRPKTIPPLKDPQRALKKLLDRPIATPPFRELFKAGENIAIIVSDITRTTKIEELLPTVISELGWLGIPDKDITFVFATGAHWSHTEKQMRQIIGQEFFNRFKKVDHDSQNKADMVALGRTSRGTPVAINRAVVKADKVIATGNITYHYFAGFSGGRKAVMPGVASYDAIQNNHKLCMGGPGNMRHPLSATGVLAGNPVHEDMEEAALMAKPAFLINTVLTEDKRIGGIFAGDLYRAFAAGTEFLNAHYRVPIKKKADLVVVSTGGYPQDINFVQAHKAMEHASYALKEGGTMILLAEAVQGFPSDMYEKYFRMGSPAAIEAALRKTYAVPGQTVFAALSKAKRFKIIWLSTHMQKYADVMRTSSAENMEAALKEAQVDLPRDFSAYIIPSGYTTFPVVE